MQQFETNYCVCVLCTGKPIAVSCAYSGRVAAAYRVGGVKCSSDKPDDKFVNLCVSIYECESTGAWLVMKFTNVLVS